MRTDALVLGAGIVGVSVALHLQARGRSVVLVDRRGAGEETSFGNGGLIQREGVCPYGFPRDIGTLLRIGLNRSIDARYHASALFELAPFLWQYWKNSGKPHKDRFLCFKNGYHGDTLGACSVSGVSRFQAVFEPLLFPVLRGPCPDSYRFAEPTNNHDQPQFLGDTR